MTEKKISFPPAWLAEARAAYDGYKAEWEQEEIERAIATGDDPVPPQGWDDFLIEYHYAELEASVFVSFVNQHLACIDD
jgi:hypothetical protein